MWNSHLIYASTLDNDWQSYHRAGMSFEWNFIFASIIILTLFRPYRKEIQRFNGVETQTLPPRHVTLSLAIAMRTSDESFHDQNLVLEMEFDIESGTRELMKVQHVPARLWRVYYYHLLLALLDDLVEDPSTSSMGKLFKISFHSSIQSDVESVLNVS